MPSRKRLIQAVDDGVPATARHDDQETLNRIRNMWHFANLCQWIYIFGQCAKIDESIDVEAIEAECLKPNSTLLADLALAILKLASSHRGLTHEILDDQLRKLYLARGYGSKLVGDVDAPRKFADLDVFAKIIVLQQLTQWTMVHPERIRDRMEEQKDVDQTSWRIEPYGWDRDDRTYYVLDDNRVYRVTEAPPVQPKPKPRSRSGRSGRRSSKRQRLTSSVDESETNLPGDDNDPADDGLGGRIWECVAVTLQEVQDFLSSLDKTRDENEKTLRRQLSAHLIPILEKQEESQKRKQLQRERELLNLAKMANAKRSSRIADKMEKQKQEDRVKEEEVQLRAAEVTKRREEKDRLKMELDRDFRMFSRQRRLQEREARRLQHEEDLAQLSEGSRSTSAAAGRVSERRRQADIARNRQALELISQEGEEWVFDCICGLFGQVDDGTHSVACETCNVWQHSKCLGISEAEADRQDFQFVCEPCRRRKEARGTAAKESGGLYLDTITCSTFGLRSSEQPEAGQSTKPAKDADSPSKERNEEHCSKSITSLSADPTLHSVSKNRQNAPPSTASRPVVPNESYADQASAPGSIQYYEDSIAVKNGGVEEYDVSSTALARSGTEAHLDTTQDLGDDSTLADKARSGSVPSLPALSAARTGL